MVIRGWFAVVFLLICTVIPVRSDASDHKYKVGDPVPLYLNKVGPFHNPRYAHDEETADDQEETGWKYIHGDVFRYPKYKSLLAAALGSGTL